jgi:hypothetical protein
MLRGKLTREEAERMYRLAYLVDSSIFRPIDAVNFGIDVRRLKEYGEVSMSKPVTKIRAHASALWERLSREQRAAFFMSYLLEELEQVSATVLGLEEQIGGLQDVREALTWINLTLFGKFPKHVVQKLEAALGKWMLTVKR